ncbi:TPA: hypothetical protein ACGT6A_004992 [Salmonella enterica]|nr:hypothetical protein [Salmonella enterica subsp. enterica serovar Newport]EFT4511290.1 hypothetical protein [Salmonella enterica subsp. enterica serovar Stanley]
MKLSPEAKQAIKTAIEQLRLLLVDDAMDTVREEVGKQLMDDEKSDCSCQIAHTGKCESNRQVVLEAPEVKVIGSNPFEEIQTEIKQLKAQVERLTMQTSCNLQTSVIGSAVISNRAEKRPNEEALNGINLKRIQETFLQIACEVIAKERI